jgi:hypothetical protein
MDLRKGSPAPRPAADGDATQAWRVSPALVWVKVGATFAFAVAAVLLLREPTTAAAAGLGAFVVGAWAVRDLLVPVRLAADEDGVTVVTGYAGRRRVPWSQIERVRVDDRPRFGVRSEMLELDAGDSLYLFSTYDLNARCGDVADALTALRARAA